MARRLLRPKRLRPQREWKPIYFFLLTYTQQGLRTLRASPNRLRRAYQTIARAGGDCRFHLMAGGPYDIIGLITAPDDQTATKIALGLRALGTVEVTVSKGWELFQEEYARFVRGMA